MATWELSTPLNIATPTSVKAKGIYLLWVSFSLGRCRLRAGTGSALYIRWFLNMRWWVNHFQVTVGCHLHCRAKCSFFHEVYLSPQLFLQFTMHTCIGEQTYRNATIEFHKKVYVGVLMLVTPCKRPKKPCLQYGLRLEVVDYHLCHGLLAHYTLYILTMPQIYKFSAKLPNKLMEKWRRESNSAQFANTTSKKIFIFP